MNCIVRGWVNLILLVVTQYKQTFASSSDWTIFFHKKSKIPILKIWHVAQNAILVYLQFCSDIFLDGYYLECEDLRAFFTKKSNKILLGRHVQFLPPCDPVGKLFLKLYIEKFQQIFRIISGLWKTWAHQILLYKIK